VRLKIVIVCILIVGVIPGVVIYGVQLDKDKSLYLSCKTASDSWAYCVDMCNRSGADRIGCGKWCDRYTAAWDDCINDWYKRHKR
jgi:hypothetical protein